MGQIVKIQPNIPLIGRMMFDDGVLSQSKFGGADQIRYSLDDDRIIYLPPSVGDKFREAGIKSGVPFKLLKKEEAKGQFRRVVWIVERLERLEDEFGEAAPAKVSAPCASTAVSNGQHSHSNGTAQTTPFDEHMGTAPARSDVFAQHLGAEAARRTTVAPQGPITETDVQAQTLIVRTGKAAVDAVLAVETYAREQGMTGFEFGADNIQKVWVSLYIDARQGGRR